ncbi:ABC transporter ATP-binding protein [Nonomuraea cavernae]|uniref:ABC transporter ATP-binding protein n=1 Tax=Nonomuraea cavernae TaxID=2045107 RepID=A0A917ZHC3_9ACTN|nr:ABC transporter ATP-binding protein [Nonomuraea cavernae]MCA2186436.1 ABC transporter ATP-binding protein [Nonomuraea cavernae]GGO82711.1 ABC transporter ATP-binding protein [Nonomuraea cavernae]
MTDPLLTVEHLATGYGDLRAVWDVSFQVWPGRITVLLGRNGSGKTTSLRAVAGLNPVHGGTMTYDGRSLESVAAHGRVALGVSYVQEGKRVFRTQTVRENLLLGGYSLKLRRRALENELDRIYELFPILHDKRDDPAGSLSGGQQQMVAIGQALMAKPRLLMLDEPSGGLAPSVVAEVMARVSALKDSGLAILLVEQAVEAAVDVADHVTVIDIGKVVVSSPVGEIDDLERIKDACMGR